MAIGDWGGEEQVPFVQSGQVSLAQAMGRFAANASSWSRVSDFVGLGDNFYTCGINCGTGGVGPMMCDRTTHVPPVKGCKADATNFRFHDVFENVYAAPSLQNLSFRVTSGTMTNLISLPALFAVAQAHAGPRSAGPSCWAGQFALPTAI